MTNSGFKSGLVIVIFLLLLAVQILLYCKSYRNYLRHDEDRPETKSRRIGYWSRFLLLDLVNCLIFCFGTRIFLAGAKGTIIDKIRNNIDIVMPIITTILISFFGLTAAAYTFQINDIHEQQQRKPNDKLFLDDYLSRTRFKFSVALWSTVLICALSISIYIVEEILDRLEITSVYKMECGFILCTLAIEVIVWMLYLNWVLFFRERYIDKYTNEILESIVNSENEKIENEKNIGERTELSDLLRRINSVELIFQRLLDNNIHVQDVFPLENRDLLVMLGGELDGIEDTKRQQANAMVRQYHDLICWRNAVIHLENSQNDKLKKKIQLGTQQRKNLTGIEQYIKENRMRNERFTDMDLSSLDFFKGSNMENADFSNCDLRDISLEGSSCTGANFKRALMSRICLNSNPPGKIIKIDRNTKLDRADFHDCNLEHAEIKSEGTDRFSMKEGTFSNVILTGSQMQRVDFEFSSFFDAQLYYNSWESCNANFASFNEAKLSNSRLCHTDFMRADFSEAVLTDSMIIDCCFEEARLYQTDFFNSKIEGGNWKKVMASNSSFKSTNIFPAGQDNDSEQPEHDAAASFRQAVLHNVDFTASALHGVDMEDCQINECIFTGASGEKNSFLNADMKNCLFNRTKWKHCFFDYVQFDQSVFKNAELSGSRFVGTSFDHCLFLSTDKGESEKSPIRIEWEKTVLKEIEKPLPHGQCEESFLFKDSYLDAVSFKGAYGLEEAMFKDATVEKVNFQGTGIKEKKLKKYASVISKCTF